MAGSRPPAKPALSKHRRSGSRTAIASTLALSAAAFGLGFTAIATQTTIVVDLPTVTSITGSSRDLDFSDRISLPTAWATSQWIVAEVAVTLQNSDSADVYRGSDNCIVDLKDNVTSSTLLAYGDTAPNALRTLPGLASDIYIMNDRSPQMSLSGPANAVKRWPTCA